MTVRDRIWSHADSRRAWEDAQARYRAMQAKPSINLSTLPDADKRRVWSYLNRQHPKIAETLKDPHIQEARALFDADVVIGQEFLQDILDAEEGIL